MALRGRSPTTSTRKKPSSWKKTKNIGECVLEVLPNDVLVGRGAGTNAHKGNIQFRKLIKERKQEYKSTNNLQDKVSIASEIVDQIYQNGGRFLKKLNDVEAAIVLPKVLERLEGRKEGDNYEDDFDNYEQRYVYEIQGAETVMEKTKQALRQKQQKRPNGSRFPKSLSPYPSQSPTSRRRSPDCSISFTRGRCSTDERSQTSSQSMTPPNGFIDVGGSDTPPNGFIGGGNNANTTTHNQDCNDWNNENIDQTGFNGLNNNNNMNNNNFSSSLSNLNANNKEELLVLTGYNNHKSSSSINNLNVNNKGELLPINTDIAPTPLSPPLLSTNHHHQQHQQQQKHPNTNPMPLMSLEQQLYQLEQHQQFQEKQLQLEKQKYERQKLELELQKLTLQHNLVLQFQQDQLQKHQELKQHQPQQQQQQDPTKGFSDSYAAFITKLKEMEENYTGAADQLLESNDNNDKRVCIRARGSEHSLGDIAEMLEGSMKDFSVKDCELHDSHTTIGSIDGILENMVGDFYPQTT